MEAALVLIVVVLLILGAVLLLLGLRGNRVGDEPHCRGCGYKLLGLESKVCPECGRSFADMGVVLGVRVRRARLMVVGSASLLVAAGGAVFAAKQHWSGRPFIQGFPFAFIRAAARFGSTDAVNEALRRATSYALSPAQLRDLVDAGPRTRSDLRASASSASWAKIFAFLAADLALTDSQRWRIVDAILNATTENDRTHDPYRAVSVSFEYIPSVIPPDWMMRIENETYRLDGQSISPRITLIHGTNFGAGRRVAVNTAGLTTGEHTLTADFDLWVDHAAISWSRSMHLDFKIAVLDSNGREKSRISTDDEVRSALTEQLHARISGFQMSRVSTRIESVRINLVADPPLPCDLPMKVFVRTADKLDYIGDFLVPRGPPYGLQTDLVWKPDRAPPDDQITVILRGDRTLAEGMPGNNEYFDGEINLGPLIVHWISERDLSKFKGGAPN